MMRTLRFAVLAAGLAFGVFSLAVARSGAGYALGGGSVLAGAAELIAGYALLAVGLIAWMRLGDDPVDRWLWLGQAAALCVLSLGVAWAWVRARRTRSALARFVIELAGSPSVGGLRDVLAATLHDPSLELAYPLADGRFADARCRPVGLQGEVTPIVRGGRQVALLSHRPGLLTEPALAEVAATARLVLENERLQAETLGIFPAMLAEEGLATAVEALAETVPLTITALPGERFGASVEAAAYFVVAETVRQNAAGVLRVCAARRDGRLVVEVETDSVPGSWYPLICIAPAAPGRKLSPRTT